MTRHVIDPGLLRAGREAARRLQRNGMQAKGRVSLSGVTQEEVTSLSGVLGARWRAPQAGLDATIDLATLDRALQESWYGCTLLDLAAAVNGAPLVDRAARRHAAATERQDGWAALRGHSAVDRHPALAAWLDRERATGAALRASEGDPFRLIRETLELVSVLAADPPMSLARFATAHCGGDPHALDRDQPLDPVLRRALAHLDGDAAPPRGAAARRERYDRWGLSCDELSATVLCCGLAPPGPALLAQSLRIATAAGEPRVLTLRELGAVSSLACGPVAFTCENPDVIAAATAALGPTCPPLICSEGWPSTACLRLLRALCAGGAGALHHGDMDPGGLRIVDHLLTVTGGSPWRMTAADHERHAAGGVVTGQGPPTVVRDLRLHDVAGAIATRGRLVREEQMVDVLLDDLSQARAQIALPTAHLM